MTLVFQLGCDGGLVVEGKVVDSAGLGVPNAGVTISDGETGELLAYCETSADGTFSLHGVLPPRQASVVSHICITAVGFVSQECTLDIATNNQQALFVLQQVQ
jgi:hypothetical protein